MTRLESITEMCIRDRYRTGKGQNRPTMKHCTGEVLCIQHEMCGKKEET